MSGNRHLEARNTAACGLSISVRGTEFSCSSANGVGLQWNRMGCYITWGGGLCGIDVPPKQSHAVAHLEAAAAVTSQSGWLHALLASHLMQACKMTSLAR